MCRGKYVARTLSSGHVPGRNRAVVCECTHALVRLSERSAGCVSLRTRLREARYTPGAPVLVHLRISVQEAVRFTVRRSDVLVPFAVQRLPSWIHVRWHVGRLHAEWYFSQRRKASDALPPGNCVP